MILQHTVIGEGRPLVILHGLFGSSDNWNTLAKRFAESRQVILVDQRNHGKSFHDERMDYPAMAEDLKQLLDHLELSQIDLLGHSMGGKTAMSFVLYYPSYVNRLLIADIGPQRYPSHHDSIIAAFQSVDFSVVSSRKEVQALFEEQGLDRGVIQFLTKNLYWREKGVLDWRVNLDTIVDNMDNILEALEPGVYEGEVLFIRGGKSDYIPQGTESSLAVQFPKARVVSMNEAGHWLHAEDPMTFFQIVMNELAAV